MKDPSNVEAQEFGVTDPLDLLPIYVKSEGRHFPGSPEVSHFCLGVVEVHFAVLAPSDELLDFLFVVSHRSLIFSQTYPWHGRGRVAVQSGVNRMKRTENTTLGYPGVENEVG